MPGLIAIKPVVTKRPSPYADPNLFAPNWIDPDIVLTERQRRDISPQEMLIGELIKGAIHDVKKAHGDDLGAALWWLFYERETARAASFIWCCYELGLDADYIREGVRKWWRLKRGGNIPDRRVCEVLADRQARRLRPWQAGSKGKPPQAEDERQHWLFKQWVRRGVQEWTGGA
jgi:hypothetical protein